MINNLFTIWALAYLRVLVIFCLILKQFHLNLTELVSLSPSRIRAKPKYPAAPIPLKFFPLTAYIMRFTK